MKRKCPKCSSLNPDHSLFGSFVRRSDGRRLRRFQCKLCKSTFSEATTQSCYRQKKRRLNARVFWMLSSGMSQRRVAKALKINRLTVVRKFRFYAAQLRVKNKKNLEKHGLFYNVQFDDLETIEHTKCKPLSVLMMVEKDTRYILGFKVCQMPAKGHLAKISRKKYGPRPDKRPLGREELFKELKPKIAPQAIITSDENPHYINPVKKWFPLATHIKTPGKRGCVAGQGELKKVGYDPLFSLNHSFAMLRANINRLFRRTWCTTKDPARLADHIEMYVYFHNQYLIKK